MTSKDFDPIALKRDFLEKGWARIPYDPALRHWVEATLPSARATLTAPDQAEWHRYQGTWFAGVRALPNDTKGAVPGGPALISHATDFIAETLGLKDIDWEPAQVSVCYPGYPKPMEGESDALLRFRRNRDAAHVDGLRREGPDRRRFLREYHAFILGIPMVDFPTQGAPFVIWEGSHKAAKMAFMEIFANLPVEAWGDIDVTDTYITLRKRLFEECRRVEIHAHPGEAYIVHRHALHGMAPWPEDIPGGPDGRMIVYFRPEFPSIQDWLHAD